MQKIKFQSNFIIVKILLKRLIIASLISSIFVYVLTPKANQKEQSRISSDKLLLDNVSSLITDFKLSK
jgi:hypothetical protein